jgi:hypothetical protein
MTVQNIRSNSLDLRAEPQDLMGIRRRTSKSRFSPIDAAPNMLTGPPSRGNPEFSQYGVLQCRPSGAPSHDWT